MKRLIAQTPAPIFKRHRVQGRRGLRQAGVTLLELLIVVAIVAILSAIALPSYTRYITKTNRAAAAACLATDANYMERFYTSNLRYDQDTTKTPMTLPTPDCASTAQTGNNYSYAVSNLTATTYTLTATPINAQLKRDTMCGTLTLDQTGTRTDSGSGAVADCWQ